MTEIEIKRKELERFIITKAFNLSDSEVVGKAIEFEKSLKKSQVI